MADYVYTLDDATRKKAVNELGEDPNELAGQVETFREWVLQQPHIKCPTDTQYLLKYLRYAKFSQLRARTVLEKFLKSKTNLPEWLDNIDFGDKKIQAVLDTGQTLVLPRKEDGQLVQLMRMGAFDPKSKKYNQSSLYKTLLGMQLALGNNEATLINGSTVLFDHTGFTMKHQAFFGMEGMLNFSKCWQNAIPGRFKAFINYNSGTVFEGIMTMIRPILSKKFQDRIILHGRMDTVYKCVPMKVLPVEYLPDEYNGPNAGTLDQLIAECKRYVLQPEVRHRILYETRPEWGIDESKRIKQAQESFRKLNID